MANSIQLSNESYRLLRTLKLPGESFSDVIKRLASARKDPLAFRRLRVRKDFDPEALRKASLEADRRRWSELWGAR